MENNLEQLLEKDATLIPEENSGIVEVVEESEALEIVGNNRAVNSNSMVLANQTNSSAVFRFDNCKGVTLGSVFNFGLPAINNGVVALPGANGIARSRDAPYVKTPTVKKMMECKDPISSAFLDILSGFFGAKWKEAMVLLQINQLFVERMIEDFSERGGIKEVIFQILSQYFKDHEEHATTGWIVTFLWRNGFKKTVWSVKEQWKGLKELEKELEN